MPSFKIDDIRIGRQRLENHIRHHLRNARVASDTHVRKGTRKPVVGNISLKKGILRIELDSVVDVRATEDASHRIVPHHLIAGRIIRNTYPGCELVYRGGDFFDTPTIDCICKASSETVTCQLLLESSIFPKTF